MAFKGMDVDLGPQVVEAIRTAGETIRGEFDDISARVQSLTWLGADADAYKSGFAAQIGDIVEQLTQLLQQRAQELEQDIQEQQTGSAS